MKYKDLIQGAWFVSQYIKEPCMKIVKSDTYVTREGTLMFIGSEVEVEYVRNPFVKIAILEEQLRQALTKLHNISNALLGETDVCTGEIQVSGVHDGGNTVDGSELRL